MSRLGRLRAGLGRLGSRAARYRIRAEREQHRLEREASQRGAAEAAAARPEEAPPRPPEHLAARARAAVLAGAPEFRQPPAAADEEAEGPAGGPPPAGPPPAGEGPGGAAWTPAGRPPPAEAIPWGMRVAAEAGWRLLVLGALIWVLMQIISALSLIVFSFTIGLLITAMLQPFVGRLKRVGFGKGSATAITAFGGFAVIGLIGWFVTWQVIDNSEDLVDQVQDGVGRLRDWILELPFDITQENLDEWVDSINQWINENRDTLTSAGVEAGTYVVEILSGAALLLFVVLFLLYDGRGVWQWFLKLVPAAARPGVAGAGPRAWITLTGYVRGTILVALIDAIGIGIGLFIIDVPLAVPLAVIVFVGAFVPVVGAVVSGALAVVVAVVTNGLLDAVLVLGVVLLVQQIEGHILQPFILGRIVRVHPLAVVLGVTAGTTVAGIAGAFVAVPLIAVTTTVVGYLRAYNEEAGRRAPGPPPRGGATVAELAPTPPPAGPEPPREPERDTPPDSRPDSPGSPDSPESPEPPPGGPAAGRS